MHKKYFKNFYYFITHLKKRARNTLAPTAHILLYHRVANTNYDPDLLSVSLENFRSQMLFLKNKHQIISLPSLIKDIHARKVRNNSIIITFDDGYADNLYNALPILEELNIPATIFISSGYINSDKSFYWDNHSNENNKGRPMTKEEVKRLSDSKYIEIGAHTVNHPRLADLSEKEQKYEILESKYTIERIIKKQVFSFAFPFGGKSRYNTTSVKLVIDAGLNCACTTIQERITNNSNVFELPRFVVRDWTLDKFEDKLKEWV